MVLVDTSIWIDFFQAPESHTGLVLVSLIKDHNNVALCGIVLQEVLQGIRNQNSFVLVRERLLKFPFIEANLDTWLLAASLYRALRAKGITIPPVDVTIAAIAIQNDIQLFSRDVHFEEVALVSDLRLYCV
ncbi:MAG: PIN domain nuclease [Desulfuromonadaceae bacterium]|nr:PIN domain nuclease [Desulfuromonadaceae bacterium]MDD2854348.1 PIN domain nuclease [Desulfuromonadaceae bacterium]